MSSSQQNIASLDRSNFNTSIIIGVVLITLIVILVMSITMNIWMKYKSIQAMSRSRNSSYTRKKSLSPATKVLTKPSPAFNKEATLPVYRNTDTWESYLKMIQTPDKLNDAVYSMKVSHTPSSSISTKVGYSPSESIDNTYKVGYSPSESIDNTYKVGYSPSESIDNTYKVGYSPSESIDNTYKVGYSPSESIDNTYKVGHSPSDSIDNTYKVGHGNIDNTCYTFNDYKLYRQSPLPKEYDDNN